MKNFKSFFTEFPDILPSKYIQAKWIDNKIETHRLFGCFFIFLLLVIFKNFIYFNWRLITLQYCGGFFIHWHESAMGVHVSTHPEPPSPPHLLPSPIPLGCPGALALSALLHALNLHWSSIPHMVIYMFQCYSLKSSHPRLLPHTPKVCSLHLSLLLPCV